MQDNNEVSGSAFINGYHIGWKDREQYQQEMQEAQSFNKWWIFPIALGMCVALFSALALANGIWIAAIFGFIGMVTSFGSMNYLASKIKTKEMEVVNKWNLITQTITQQEKQPK